uniref:Uncharacterized protein n=1 Tax=Rhizophora mucronata TaxID=61149 RepID=A0A2P2IKP9_RHIMU
MQERESRTPKTDKSLASLLSSNSPTFNFSPLSRCLQFSEKTFLRCL